MRRMIKRWLALLAALLLLAGCMPPIGPDKPPPSMDRDGNKIFDSLDEILGRVGPDDLLPVMVMMGAHSDLLRLDEVEEIQVKHRYGVVPAVAASMTRNQVLRLAKEGYVKHIEHDAEVRVLMNTASQWFGATRARADFGVDGDRDGSTGYSSGDIVIAVIDTGIDPGHADLDGGKIIGWRDWVNNRSTPYDDHGHGTHVAGIAAGSGAGNAAYVGVAPGAALVGLKVLDRNGSGSLSNVTAAVDWAVANKDTYNIRVISMSLGSSGSSDGTDTLSQAVNRAAEQGVIPVVAAGNSGPGRYTVGSPGAAIRAITRALA